jgi:hypothetical protein
VPSIVEERTALIIKGRYFIICGPVSGNVAVGTLLEDFLALIKFHNEKVTISSPSKLTSKEVTLDFASENTV